jgi:hypothetical protein
MLTVIAVLELPTDWVAAIGDQPMTGYERFKKHNQMNIEKFARIVGTPRPSTDQEIVHCPHCNSRNVWFHKSYAGKDPVITAIGCNDCEKLTELCSIL